MTGSDDPTRRQPVVRALTAVELAALAATWPDRLADERLAPCAEAAEARWGLAGVIGSSIGGLGSTGPLGPVGGAGVNGAAGTAGVSESAGAAGLLLLTTADTLPARHPLAAGGLADDTAGLLLADPWAGPTATGLGRWLTAALAGHLQGRCRALEAQGAVASFLATPWSPAASWLGGVGFHPLGFPSRRYRLDLDTTLPDRPPPRPDRAKARWWWNARPAPATRGS
ncbi:MAG: hypothetical protein LBL55_04750 [Propionibacteriaceae bacterium]|jgi:hypothetical protein|nr:hypothetical protein [Propionibacteriaceae bacterium]